MTDGGGCWVQVQDKGGEVEEGAQAKTACKSRVESTKPSQARCAVHLQLNLRREEILGREPPLVIDCYTPKGLPSTLKRRQEMCVETWFHVCERLGSGLPVAIAA